MTPTCKICAFLSLMLAIQSGAQVGSSNSQPSQPNRLAEFWVQVDDGLGRPLPGANVMVFLPTKSTNGEENRVVLGTATSQSNGIARGRYNRAAVPFGESFMVELGKRGYATIIAGPQVTYQLPRIFTASDVAQLAKLDGFAQREPLTELLAGEINSTNQSLDEMLFANATRFKLTLRALAGTGPGVGRKAAEVIALIADPDEVRLLLGPNMTPNGDSAVNRWAYAVASSLLAPTTEREWSFLKSCAMGDFGDRWVDTAGIRSLRLIASPRSRQMLEEIREINPARSNEIASAILYINSKPATIEDASLTKAAGKLSAALDSGFWLGNETPRYNTEKDKSLIDCNFVLHGNEYIVYTATFQRANNLWKLRGVRESRHAILPDAPGTPRPAR